MLNYPSLERVVDRIYDATVDAVSRQLRYMFGYKGLIKVLNTEIMILDSQEGWLSETALKEKDGGKAINESVLKWQQDVKRIQECAEEFSEKYRNRQSWKCIQCLPIPKPVTRLRQGRKALRMAKRVAELVDSGKDLLLKGIEYLPPVEILPKPDTSFRNFESRKFAYEKLWKELVTDSSSMIFGIYGMAGVGKTRMVEQVGEEAIKKKIFDMVARVDVGSGKLNVIHLQDQIAEYFDCHFESQDDVDRRASQLENSIMNRGKILIILDDVWSKIPFDIIGIPFGNGHSSRNCKILLTSQEEDVCLQNNCEHPVHITALTSDEGWDLFKTIIGTRQIDSLQHESLAKEVCNQCVGLPLLIHVVCKALEFMPPNSWEDTLCQLKNCQLEDIPEAGSEELYACLKLSINFP